LDLLSETRVLKLGDQVADAVAGTSVSSDDLLDYASNSRGLTGLLSTTQHARQ